MNQPRRSQSKKEFKSGETLWKKNETESDRGKSKTAQSLNEEPILTEVGNRDYMSTLDSASELNKIFRFEIRNGQGITTVRESAVEEMLMEMRSNPGWKLRVALFLQYLGPKVHEEIHQYLKCMAQLIEAMAVPVEKKPSQNPVVQMLQINQETGPANNYASQHELRRGSLGTEMLEQLEKIRQAIEQQTRVLELTTYAMNSILSRDEWEHLLFDKSKNPEAFKQAQEKFLKFAELAPLALTKSESGSLTGRGSPNFLLGYPGFENEYLPLCFALLDTSVNHVRKKGKLPTKDQVLFTIKKIRDLKVINAKKLEPIPVFVVDKKDRVAQSVWSENWRPAGLKDLPNARPHRGRRTKTR